MSTTTPSTTAAVTEIPASSRVDLVSPKGRVTGQRITFGAGTVPALRKYWKAKGLSNTKASLKVRETLADEAQLRWALHAIAMEELRSAGKVPTVCDIRAQGATVKFAEPPKAPKAPAKAKALTPEVRALQAEIDRLRALVGEKSAVPVTLDV